MAYNVKQLEQLQDMIGTEAEVPNAMDRYNAMQLLKRGPARQPVRREGGGDMGLQNSVEEVASKGRYGDTMLIHVNPEEVQGLASIAPLTTNPETGLPEAFLPAAIMPFVMPALTGAAIGGIGSAITGGDPLKGAAFGALGGVAGPAIGAATAGTALGGMWTGLGAIGQGMLVGGAMGGVRSLFGDSDNPMRDILMGAAMGGLSGAMSGDPVSSASSPGSNTVQTEIPTVPMVKPSYIGTDGSASMAGTGTNIVHGVPVTPPPRVPIEPNPTMYGQAGAATRPIPSLSNPATTRVPITQHPAVDWTGRAVEGTSLPSGNAATLNQTTTGDPVALSQREATRDAYNIGGTENVGGDSKAAATTADAAEKTGLGKLGDWWDRRSDLEKAGIIGGGGLLGYSMLQPQYPEPLEEQEEIVEFPRVDPLPIRTPVGRNRDEIIAQYLSSSPTAGQPQSWFTEQDVNVAKQGGIVGLYPGGSTGSPGGGNNPAGHPGNPYGPAEHPAITNRRGRGRNDPVKPPPPVEEAIQAREFTINPFNAQETLARIGGSSPSTIEDAALFQSLLDQSTAGVPQSTAGVPQVTATAFQEQGDAALEDLLNRAANLPQLQEAATGGIVGLATGGNTPVFEGRVMGQGDGMDDDVAFGVVPQTPADIPNTPDMALLSSDEYVMPADVVSMLGNGSSTAGSKMLDQFNQLLRKKAHGTNKQQTQLDAGKELSSLI